MAGLPLVFALQSFLTDDALHFSDNALTDLLFGVRVTGARRDDGTLEVVTTPIESHVGSRTVPSNFFAQSGVENVSAVLWSNSGTVAKFGRMGYQDGLASAGFRMRRVGTRYVMDHDASEPAPFSYEVGSRRESWAEGLVLVHNPQALRPVPREALPELVHHVLEDGRVVSYLPAFYAFNSLTLTEVLPG